MAPQAQPFRTNNKAVPAIGSIIGSISAAAQHIGDAASRVTLAGDPSTQSQALATEMTRFLATIRAA